VDFRSRRWAFQSFFRGLHEGWRNLSFQLGENYKKHSNPLDSLLHADYIKFTHKSASVKKMNIPNLLTAPKFNGLKAFSSAPTRIPEFL